MRRLSKNLLLKLNKYNDAFIRWLVWRMPHKMVMWAYYRVLAHGTSGKFGSENISNVKAMDAIERWNDPEGGDKKFGIGSFG